MTSTCWHAPSSGFKPQRAQANASWLQRQLRLVPANFPTSLNVRGRMRAVNTATAVELCLLPFLVGYTSRVFWVHRFVLLGPCSRIIHGSHGMLSAGKASIVARLGVGFSVRQRRFVTRASSATARMSPPKVPQPGASTGSLQRIVFRLLCSTSLLECVMTSPNFISLRRKAQRNPLRHRRYTH